MNAGYFERLGPSTFRATDLTQGAWDIDTQHIAPALGLLSHAVELDRDARREDGLIIGRLSFDILGTVPIDVMDVDIRVVRPGRTIELVEAALLFDGRAVVRLRAWLMMPHNSESVRGTALEGIEAPETMEPWKPSEVWPGGFIASVELRRAQKEPGRASYWARSSTPLLTGEDSMPTATAVRLFDIANGMTVRADPTEVAFPNIDLTAHLFAQPTGEWIGFDTSVSFGSDGIGLTHSTLHDSTGPIGTVSQILTVRG